MLKSILVEGFQSHVNTRLDLSDGINVVVGTSDSGKTALVVRAFQWLRTNRPLGTSFIHHGADGAAVSVEVDDHELVRRRAGSSNCYLVDGVVFEAMKQAVPEEVGACLNMKDINIQAQLDGHFLVLSPPGQIAAYINEITKLDKVDDAVKVINQMLNKAAADTASLSEEKDRLTQELAEPVYGMLVDFEAVLSEVDLLVIEQGKVTANEASLSSIITELVEQVLPSLGRAEELAHPRNKGVAEAVSYHIGCYEEAADESKALVELADELVGVDETITHHSGILEHTKEAAALSAALDDLLGLDKQIAELRVWADGVDDCSHQLDHFQAIVDQKKAAEALLAACSDFETVLRAVEGLNGVCDEVVTCEAALGQALGDTETKRRERRELVEGLSWCPLCDTPFGSDEQKQRVVSSLLEEGGV
jgi:hypothetical protein